MREILFRGKRLDNGEWVEGTTVVRYLRKENTFIGERGDRSAVYKDAETDNIVRINSVFFAVDPATIGQYTGMKDKNGKRIFEGDVLVFDAYGNHYRGVVDIVRGNASVVCAQASPFLDYAVLWYGAVCIGTVHDNPELLEVRHE